MKKVLSLILVFIIVVFCVGCGKVEVDSQKATKNYEIPSLALVENSTQIEIKLVHPLADKGKFDIINVGILDLSTDKTTVTTGAWVYDNEKNYIENFSLKSFDKSKYSSDKGELVAIVAKKAFGYNEEAFDELAFLFKGSVDGKTKFFFLVDGEEVSYSQYFEKLMEEKIEWDKVPHSSN